MRRKSEYGVDGATLRQRRLPVKDVPATLHGAYMYVPSGLVGRRWFALHAGR